MAKPQQKLTARNRVREARAQLDAERAERTRRVDEAAEAFWNAAADIVVAREAIEAAEAAQVAAIGAMVDLQQDNGAIRTLCGLSDAEVRRLKKLASPKSAPAARASDAPTPTMPDPALSGIDES